MPWRYELADQAGKTLGLLAATDRSFQPAIMAPVQATCTIRSDDPLWPQIQSGVSRGKVYTPAGQLVVYGPLIADEEAGEDGKIATTKLTISDLAWELGHRGFTTTPGGIQVGSQDIAAVMFNVLGTVNAAYDTGIIAGLLTDAGTDATLTWAGWKKALEALADLAKLTGAPEWEIAYPDRLPASDNFDDNDLTGRWTTYSTGSGLTMVEANQRFETRAQASSHNYGGAVSHPGDLLDWGGGRPFLFIDAQASIQIGFPGDHDGQEQWFGLVDGFQALVDPTVLAKSYMVKVQRSGGATRVSFWTQAAAGGPVQVGGYITPFADTWLRLRENGGTVYFDSSADGQTWANRLSVARPAWHTAAFKLVASIRAGDPAGIAAKTYWWDNFVAQYIDSHGLPRPMPTFRTWNTGVGTDRSTSVFLEYGGGRRNCRTYKRRRSIDDQANYVNELSQDGLVVHTVSDAAAIAAAGARRETTVTASNPDTDLATLTAAANEELAAHKDPAEVVELEMHPQRALLYGRDYVIGDTVRARVREAGATRVDEVLRIWGVTVAIDDLDTEIPKFSLAPPATRPAPATQPERTARDITDHRRRLERLEQWATRAPAVAGDANGPSDITAAYAGRIVTIAGSLWIDDGANWVNHDYDGVAADSGGALPAAGQAGRLFRLTTDGRIYLDDGAAWWPVGGDVRSATLPAAGRAGRVQRNSANGRLYVDSGAAWVPVGGNLLAVNLLTDHPAPAAGMMAFRTSDSTLWVHDGANWRAVSIT